MSFKEYRKKKHEHSSSKHKEEKLPDLETILGSHAIEKAAEKLASMETRMGSHSKEKQVNEAVVMSDDVAHIHNNVAPIHDHLLTPEELNAVKNYSDDSSNVNSALHQHYKYGHIPKNTYKRDVSIETSSKLDTALDKHQTTDDTVVYTGIKKSPSSYFRDPARKVKVHLPAYTSTSTDHKVARFFASDVQDPADEDHGIDSTVENKHVLKLHIPKGTKAMSLVKHSWMPDEQEILLHRGHSIVIHPNPEYAGNNTYHWTAHVLKHEPETINKD